MPKLALALALLIGLAACDELPSEPVGESDRIAGEVPVASFEEQPEEADGAHPASALAPGTVEAVLHENGADLHANEAPLSDVLQSLAVAAGFSLDVGDSQIEDRRLTARIEDAPIFDLLAVVLRGVDYELAIDFDPASQGHRIALLRIRPSLGSEEVLQDDLGDALYALLDGPDPDVVLAVIDALARSGDPGAIEELEPLLEDEDPDVRAAAAEAIEALGASDGSLGSGR